MRINKFIAHAGLASRRKAEELIKKGLVTINGQVVRELATTVKSGDQVEVSGTPIYNEEKVYYLLNKPRGVISSVSDDKGRKTVVNLLPTVKERIYPVGRLDWDTSGLLILTNDGDFTDKMIHPRNEIDKVYLARVKGIATRENLRPLTRGVVIDGKKTKPARYTIVKVDAEKNRSVVELVIHEGRNHQVKKMFESVGLLVDKLSRTQFGTLDLTGLRPGEYRRLNKKEISQLHNAAVNKTNDKTPRRTR
jgi:23S rRNA pseudouridine2605 synthase